MCISQKSTAGVELKSTDEMAIISNEQYHPVIKTLKLIQCDGVSICDQPAQNNNYEMISSGS